MQSVLLLLCAFLVALVHCSTTYTLVDNFSGTSFFNNFNFFTGADPTHGYVTYVGASEAASSGLTSVSNGVVNIRSDSKNVASGSGRKSVRITSNKSYNGGLFLFDVAHMPFGCGTWPAIWTFGPNWPNSGEIDILEGVNNINYNAATLHTKAGCTMPSVFETGKQVSSNCDVAVNGNQGCSVQDLRTSSYGAGYNSNKGGVHAMRWTSTAIDVWFFPRNAIPADISSGTPNPAAWGTPLANFPLGSSCPSSYFANHNIILDNTFCGDWAGAVFAQQCPNLGSCTAYVQNNPGAFSEAYWAINYFKVYQPTSGTATAGTSSSPTPAPTPSTSSSSSGTATSGCGSGLLYCPGNRQCYSSVNYVCSTKAPYLCPTSAKYFCNGGCSPYAC